MRGGPTAQEGRALAGDAHISTSEPYRAHEQLGRRKLPVQDRARETVDLILETAAVLVDEVGVVAFTTNMVAERAGVRVRTIYRYFPNKLGILVALLVRLNAGFEEQLQAYAELADPECDWRELLDAWIEELMRWTRERPGARLTMSWSHVIPELMALQDRMDEEWTQHMMKAMRARGVDLPPKQLYSVCRNFGETLDSLSFLAASNAHDCEAEMIQEMRGMLIRYLAVYLD